MKYPKYDSPFEKVVSDLTTQMVRNIDDMCWQAVQRVGINVDKDKMLAALKQDSERYRKAYENGYETGYEKRDDDIVRCKDCKHYSKNTGYCECGITHGYAQTWFCANGERRDDDG